MKKYLLLLAAFGLFFFSSCSNDDDGGETQPTIEGQWRLTSVNPPVLDLSCDQDSTISFNDDGSTTWTWYDAENDCEASTSSGTWKQNSGDNYTVGIPEVGNVDGTVTFLGGNRFNFVTSIPQSPLQVTLTFEK